MENSVIIIISVISNVVLASAVLVLISFYKKTRGEYIRLRSDEKRLKRSVRVGRKAKKEAAKVIDEANQRSIQILQQSSMKAQQIINNAQFVTQEEKDKFSKLMDSVANAQAASFQNLIAGIDTNINGLMSNISVQIQKEVAVQVGKLQEEIQKSTLQFSSNYQKLLEEEKARAEKELEEYKAVKYKEFEGKINEILKEVTQKFLGKALNVEEHQEIVKNALSYAKRQKLL